MMRNSSVLWKMLVESWKFRCQQQCLANFNILRTGKPVVQLDNTRRNMLELSDESMRIRMEGSQNKNHEDHIVGRGMNSLSHYNFVRKFIPIPQAMKKSEAKTAVEKTVENSGMAADESQKQKKR